MTEADVHALHVRYGQILQHLSANNRKLDDQVAATTGATQAVWAVEAKVSGLVQKVNDHDRRLTLAESWRASKDDETTATGRHNIEKLQQQLAARDEAKAARKSTIIKWAAGVLGTVIGGSVLTWVGVAIAGCM